MTPSHSTRVGLPAVGQLRGRVVGPEVHRHEADVGRDRPGAAPQDAPLGRLRGRMINLEDGDVAQLRQAVGTAVEPGTEDQGLLHPGQGRGYRLVD